MKIINTEKISPGSLKPHERECIVEGCVNPSTTRTAYCLPHYKQQWYLKSVGRTELKERTSQEMWIHKITGYVMIKVKGELVYEHRHLAEKALGRPLPKGAVVHHTGARCDNHGFFKLVICPNQAYHSLLHARAGDSINQYK